MGYETNGAVVRLGYARVSTADQNLGLQQDALEKAGCERIFEDTASGVRTDRSGLSEALAYAREGDTFVVWKLDRLGRSLRHLVETVADLHARRIGFQSLQEQIDTTTSGGKLIFHVFAALAEFERDLIRERTAAGLTAARARGRKGGRPVSLTAGQISMARLLLTDPATRVEDICRTLRVSRATLYRHLKKTAI